jgi:hypothetical protein
MKEIAPATIYNSKKVIKKNEIIIKKNKKPKKI